MSWFSEGYAEAEKMSASAGRKSRRNFWTKKGESATVRFLSSARESFNYKRAFLQNSPGQKYFTSPGPPDPFVESNVPLQATFAWKILDRRILEFQDSEGKDVKIGPRLQYIAFGQRDRKALVAFENEMLEQHNEELKEDGKDPVTLDQYNITHYDIKLVKPDKAAWQFFAVRGGKVKKLSDADKEIVEQNDFTLEEELRPLPVDQIRSLLTNATGIGTQTRGDEKDAASTYSYGDDNDEEEPTFFDEGSDK